MDTVYTLKGFKTFKGHEGEPLAQGTLYLGAAKVADWSDDSHGGMMRLDFVSKSAQAAFTTFAREYLTTHRDSDGEPYDLSANDWSVCETTVQALSYAHEETLKLRRLVKTGVYFRLREPSGALALYSVKAAYTAELVAQLRAKHGERLVELVNETLGVPLVEEDAAREARLQACYKKQCKTAILYSLKQPDGSVVVYKVPTPYTAVQASIARLKHGANLVEILNERFLPGDALSKTLSR